MAEKTIIAIGQKPVANYALAVAHRHGEGVKVITIRARGARIGIAADAANMALNMGLPLRRGEARWGQEDGPKGRPVSWIEIDLAATAA